MDNKYKKLLLTGSRVWDTTNHKRIIIYCDKCSECKMMFESDTMTIDDFVCKKHGTNMVRFIENSDIKYF